MTADALRKLLTEDKEWLLRQPRTLEREHIAVGLDWLHKNAEAVVAADRAARGPDDQP